MAPLLRTVALALAIVALLAVTMIAPTEARKHAHHIGADPELLAAVRADLPYNVSTALADYLAIEEDVYSWVEMPEFEERGDGFVNYVLNVTSLRWLDETKVSRSIWWHFVCIMVPDEARFPNNAFLYITGLTNTDARPPPITHLPSWNPQLELVATVKEIVITIWQVPNAPILFFDETPVPLPRAEDALIAWTWKHFLSDPSDPTFLVRFPMVKSAIAAMDASTEFLTNPGTGRTSFSFNLTKWVVSGASKRGLTTWMVGAFDERVIGIVPLVYDLLNFVPSIHHHYRSYGGWSWALGDYTGLALPGSFDSSLFQVIQDMVDPYSYLTNSRLATVPKFVISAAGDQFLNSDNVRWFWDTLQGEKHFRTFPGLDHSMGMEVIPALISFTVQVQLAQSRPEYNWTIDATSGEISLSVLPYQGAWPLVEFWYAPTIKETDGTYSRDWRLATCPNGCPDPTKHIAHNVPWFHDDKYVTSTVDGDYLEISASMDIPENGWVAFAVILTWADPNEGNFTISTSPSILPLTYPYPDCQGEGCIAKLV